MLVASWLLRSLLLVLDGVESQICGPPVTVLGPERFHYFVTKHRSYTLLLGAMSICDWIVGSHHDSARFVRVEGRLIATRRRSPSEIDISPGEVLGQRVQGP